MLAIYELYLLLFSELIHKPRPCADHYLDHPVSPPTCGHPGSASLEFLIYFCLPQAFPICCPGDSSIQFVQNEEQIIPTPTPLPGSGSLVKGAAMHWSWRTVSPCTHFLRFCSGLSALISPFIERSPPMQASPHAPLSPSTTPLLEWLSEPPLLFLNTSAVESHPALVCWVLIFPPWALDNVLYITKGKCFHLYSLRWSFCSPSLPPVQSCCFTLPSVSIKDMHTS